MKPRETAPSFIPLRFGVFAMVFGLLLGLSFVKFANPVVMEDQITPPADLLEAIFSPWPIVWGYWFLAATAIFGLATVRWCRVSPIWLVALPMVWLAWQFIAGTQSLNAGLTRATLKHFVSCVVSFYLGLFALRRDRNLSAVRIWLLVAFIVVVWVGVHEHFVGQAATREWVNHHEKTHWQELSAEELNGLERERIVFKTSDGYVLNPKFREKVESRRIASTLFYPNSLAGAIILLLPLMLVTGWQIAERFTPVTQWFIASLIGAGALGCLYWSGSKAGWLLVLLLGLVAMLRSGCTPRVKLALVGSLFVVGLAGFLWKYSGFFQKGATSVVARRDYWEAALRTVAEKPLFGAGPGTFSIAYQKVKRPESEMARLAHNDYLQQASDSGLPGFLTYTAFIASTLLFLARAGGIAGDWLRFSVWLGLLGWSLQGLVEFGLYIPALAWTAFCLMGWLIGTANQIDKEEAVR